MAYTKTIVFTALVVLACKGFAQSTNEYGPPPQPSAITINSGGTHGTYLVDTRHQTFAFFVNGRVMATGRLDQISSFAQAIAIRSADLLSGQRLGVAPFGKGLPSESPLDFLMDVWAAKRLIIAPFGNQTETH